MTPCNYNIGKVNNVCTQILNTVTDNVAKMVNLRKRAQKNTDTQP